MDLQSFRWFVVVRVDSASSTIRFEDETEHRADEELHLEMLAHIPFVQSAYVKVHPTFHRMMDGLTDMPFKGILYVDPVTVGHVKVPKEPSDRVFSTV